MLNETINEKSFKVLFVQMLGMLEQGGSFKIFLNLFEKQGISPDVLVYGLHPPRLPYNQSEIFVKERFTFGRLEHTRLASSLNAFRIFSWARSREKVFQVMNQLQPEHVHLLLHGLGFKHAYDWCRLKQVPFSVSVHDDILHLAKFDLWKNRIEDWAAEVWRGAFNRFVISPEMGDEYSRRYGKRDWIQITDGLDAVAPQPRVSVSRRLNVYFAGGLNVHYEPVFLAFQQALKLFKLEHPDWQVRFIVRGGRRLVGEDSSAPPIEVLPFASQQDVLRDFETADLLYLPLSIDPEYANFAKFSLSTKMITYLGSGLPIFYHGPADSAAYRLLQKNNASASCHSSDPVEILAALKSVERERTAIVENAIKLGGREFQIDDIRNRFWSAIKSDSH